MMSGESAEALILVTMDSVAHRQNCLWGKARDLPWVLLAEALAVLEADGEDVREARQWFADHGVQLPAPQVSPESEALIRISERILGYLGRSNEPRTRVELEARVGGRTAHMRTALKNLCVSGRVVQSGAGSKGDPLRYDLFGRREQESQKPA